MPKKHKKEVVCEQKGILMKISILNTKFCSLQHTEPLQISLLEYSARESGRSVKFLSLAP